METRHSSFFPIRAICEIRGQIPMNKIRTGVIGLGGIGKNHARIMAEIENIEFAAVFDANTVLAQETAERYRTRAASSIDELGSLVDAATIATPTPTHYPIAKALMEKGRHVLIEKPITEQTSHARELVELASRANLVLQVGHVERFNPVLSALESRLTHPRFIEAHRLSPYPNRSTEIGVVLDLMIHDIEIILHLVRSAVKSVDAVGIPVLSKSEDIANARIRFESGCVANITVSRVSSERMRKIRVFSGGEMTSYVSLDYRAQEGFIYRIARDGEEESSVLKKVLAAKLGVGKDSTIV